MPAATELPPAAPPLSAWHAHPRVALLGGTGGSAAREAAALVAGASSCRVTRVDPPLTPHAFAALGAHVIQAYPAAALLGVRLGWLLGVPCVLRVPAGQADRLDRAALRRARLVVAATEADAVALQAQAVPEASRLRIVAEGVDLADLPSPGDAGLAAGVRVVGDSPVALVLRHELPEPVPGPGSGERAAADGVGVVVIANDGQIVGAHAWAEVTHTELTAARARAIPVVWVGSQAPVGAGVIHVPATGPDAGLDAVKELLADAPARHRIGQEGRWWLTSHHETSARIGELERIWAALAEGREPADPPPPPAAPASVSVVVLSDGDPDRLQRTLDALAAQTHPAEEVLLVPGGGDVAAVASLVARRIPGWPFPGVLRLLDTASGAAAVQARNAAVAAATGDAVAFTGEGDEPVPVWLESLVAGFATGAGLVQGRTVRTAEDADVRRTDPADPYAPVGNAAYTRAALQTATLPGGDGPFHATWAARVADQLGTRLGGAAGIEEVELAWRARRCGVAALTSAAAVVHRSPDPGPPDAWASARRVAAVPLVARQVPEVRAAVLTARHLLGRRHAALFAAAAGAVVAARGGPRRGLVLALPYLREVASTRSGTRAVAEQVARDVAEVAGLAAGSVRAKYLVL